MALRSEPGGGPERLNSSKSKIDHGLHLALLNWGIKTFEFFLVFLFDLELAPVSVYVFV